jgi:hypothetical protein
VNFRPSSGVSYIWNSLRVNTQRGTATHVQQFDQLVETRVRETGESYGDAMIVVSREHRDLGDRRNRAVSVPIGPGGVAMVGT